MILVGSKCDVANKTKLAKLKKFAKGRGVELYPISAVTGEGVEKLKYAIAEKVEEVRRADSDRLSLPDPFGGDQRPTTNEEP
jgi:GTPase